MALDRKSHEPENRTITGPTDPPPAAPDTAPPEPREPGAHGPSSHLVAPESPRLGSPRAPGAPRLKHYRSRPRAAIRFVLQRVLFRAIVLATSRPSVTAAPGVHDLEGGFVVVSNHTSHLDAPIIAQGLPRRQARYLAAGVAYDYFFRVWHKRWFVRWLFNAFAIYRDGSRSSSDVPRALLSMGVPILVFPEGGRQADGRTAPFKTGTARLAMGANVPIVPTAVIGGYEAMPKGRSWPLPGRPPIRVAFGEPLMPLPGDSPAAWTARIESRIEELYDSGAHAIGVPGLADRDHGPGIYGDAATNDDVEGEKTRSTKEGECT